MSAGGDGPGDDPLADLQADNGGPQFPGMQPNPGQQIPNFGPNPSKPEIGQLLDAAARKYGVPPEIAKAVAYKESGWNARASSFDGGHGKGVMQIDDRSHPFARGQGVWDAGQNIEYGVKLLADLRGMGETAAFANRTNPALTRGILMRAMEIYAQRFSDPDGRIRATFEFVTLSGWAPGPDQPKAKRPGSATVRLADALGVKEQAAGEKTGPKT